MDSTQQEKIRGQLLRNPPALCWPDTAPVHAGTSWATFTCGGTKARICGRGLAPLRDGLARLLDAHESDLAFRLPLDCELALVCGTATPILLESGRLSGRVEGHTIKDLHDWLTLTLGDGAAAGSGAGDRLTVHPEGSICRLYFDGERGIPLKAHHAAALARGLRAGVAGGAAGIHETNCPGHLMGFTTEEYGSGLLLEKNGATIARAIVGHTVLLKTAAALQLNADRIDRAGS